MDFIPANAIGPIFATAITLIVTYFIAFFNSARDKNFVLLERYIKLKKDMGEAESSKTFDELIRRRLNSYVVSEMDGRDRRKRTIHIIYTLGIFWGLFFVWAVLAVIDKDYVESGVCGILFVFFLWLWSKQSDKGRIRDFENRINYEAHLLDGDFVGQYALLPLLRPSYGRNAPGTWQHPHIYVQNMITGKVGVYEQVSSAGYIHSRAEDTTLSAEYRFTGETKMKRRLKKSNAFMSSGSLYPAPEKPLSPLLQK